MRSLEVGDTIGVRGPYGNSFPIEEFYGKNLVFVAGGIALPPLRTVIWNCLDLREKFGDITIVYGARTEADLVYKRELAEWEERPDVRLVKTVDPGGKVRDVGRQGGLRADHPGGGRPRGRRTPSRWCAVRRS